jgi:hypothetical protein
LKFDKMKPVREATLEALNALKDVPDSEALVKKKENEEQKPKIDKKIDIR